jgi:hypothetical protein
VDVDPHAQTLLVVERLVGYLGWEPAVPFLLVFLDEDLRVRPASVTVDDLVLVGVLGVRLEQQRLEDALVVKRRA